MVAPLHELIAISLRHIADSNRLLGRHVCPSCGSKNLVQKGNRPHALLVDLCRSRLTEFSVDPLRD